MMIRPHWSWQWSTTKLVAHLHRQMVCLVAKSASSAVVKLMTWVEPIVIQVLWFTCIKLCEVHMVSTFNIYTLHTWLNNVQHATPESMTGHGITPWPAMAQDSRRLRPWRGDHPGPNSARATAKATREVLMSGCLSFMFSFSESTVLPFRHHFFGVPWCYSDWCWGSTERREIDK